MKNHQDIVKSNVMINSYLAGDLTLVSTRLIYACLLQIKSKSDVFDHTRRFVIKGNELADITGRKSKDGYKSLVKAVKDNLERAGFHTKYYADGSRIFPDDDEAIQYTSIVNTIRYVKGKGEVHISFSPDVIPFVSQLKGNFTKMMAHNIIPMKSKYGMRLYELCLSWLGTEREFTIEEFRKLFGVTDKYKTLKNLKARVLNPALKDIENYTDLKVQFGQVKSGREVVAFQFSITKKLTRSKPEAKKMTLVEYVQANPESTKGKNENEIYKMMEQKKKVKDQEQEPAQEEIKPKEEDQLSLLQNMLKDLDD